MIAALVLCAMAALVACGPPPRARLRRLDQPVTRRSRRPWPLWVALAAIAVIAGVLVGRLGYVVAAATVIGVVIELVRRARADRRAKSGRMQVTEAATTLALLQRAGMIPTVALREAASGNQCLGSAAAAGRLGIDITGALEKESRAPGREGLRSLVAAWQVSERTGAPIAEVIGRVADTLRQDQQVRAAVDAEMSAARISGRIMACLPIFGIALGSAVGANPLGFLTTHWAGEMLVLAGVLLSVAGIAWTERLSTKVLP